MSRIAYVNGRYLPRAQAQVSIEDRGYPVRRRRLRSLRGAGRAPDRRAPPHGAARSLAQRTAHRAADDAGRACRRPARDHRAQPRARRHRLCRRSPAAWRAAIFRFRRPARGRLWWSPRAATISRGSSNWQPTASPSSRVPDIRWGRVDIKSVALLPNVLAKQAAREQGAREAWLVDAQGRVTEGASSNAWIVTRDGKIVTHPLGRDILSGITRSVVLDVIKAQGLALRGARLHGRGGLCRARGLHHLGQPDRAAGVAHRRPAGRQRRARPDRDRLAARLPPPRRALLSTPAPGAIHYLFQ